MKATLIIFAVIILAWACGESPAPAPIAAPKTEMKMAEVSELAALMKSMHEDAKIWRKAAIEGRTINDTVDFYAALTTNEPTKEGIQTPAYNAMARYYQDQLDGFLETGKTALSAKGYNNLVKACVACHQGYCTGPIPTIEKLYIPNP
jgi:cytochrome c5